MRVHRHTVSVYNREGDLKNTLFSREIDIGYDNLRAEIMMRDYIRSKKGIVEIKQSWHQINSHFDQFQITTDAT